MAAFAGNPEHVQHGPAIRRRAQADAETRLLVREKIGLGFATALRAILRQDPDVILLGEIRDQETAEVAFHAALTGHQVFSTLHTNSATATVARLLDLGLKPFVLANALEGIIAQRLVRKICEACREPYTIEPRTRERLGPSFSHSTSWVTAAAAAPRATAQVTKAASRCTRSSFPTIACVI